MRKSIKFICMSLLIILLCFTFMSGTSYAAIDENSVGQDIVEQYENDNNYFENISDIELLNTWFNKVHSYGEDFNNLYNENSLFGGKYYENYQRAEKCKDALQARIADLTTDASKENGTGESDDELKAKDYKEILKWLQVNNATYLSENVKTDWREKIEKNKDKLGVEYTDYCNNRLNGMSHDDAYEQSWRL